MEFSPTFFSPWAFLGLVLGARANMMREKASLHEGHGFRFSRAIKGLPTTASAAEVRFSTPTGQRPLSAAVFAADDGERRTSEAKALIRRVGCGTAEPVPLVHRRNSKACCHPDSNRSTKPARFCSAKLSLKQSTSYIIKKPVDPLICTPLVLTHLSTPIRLRIARSSELNGSVDFFIFAKTVPEGETSSCRLFTRSREISRTTFP